MGGWNRNFTCSFHREDLFFLQHYSHTVIECKEAVEDHPRPTIRAPDSPPCPRGNRRVPCRQPSEAVECEGRCHYHAAWWRIPAVRGTHDTDALQRQRKSFSKLPFSTFPYPGTRWEGPKKTVRPLLSPVNELREIRAEQKRMRDIKRRRSSFAGHHPPQPQRRKSLHPVRAAGARGEKRTGLTLTRTPTTTTDAGETGCYSRFVESAESEIP